MEKENLFQKTDKRRIIRRAVEGDVAAVHRIDGESASSWTRDQFSAELSNSFSLFLVAETDGAVTGFAVGWLVADEIQLNRIAVAKDWKRSGAGSALIGEMIRLCAGKRPKKIYLEVREDNDGARSLYRHLGFCETGIRKKYYGARDAILMDKNLSG